MQTPVLKDNFLVAHVVFILIIYIFLGYNKMNSIKEEENEMSNVTKCMCEECHYNDNHNCQAEGIEVMSSGNNKVETTDGT